MMNALKQKLKQKSLHKGIKQGLQVTLYCFVILWLAISSMILSTTPAPPACPKPYQAWALTWPIWKVAPRNWFDAFVLWSSTLCSSSTHT